MSNFFNSIIILLFTFCFFTQSSVFAEVVKKSESVNTIKVGFFHLEGYHEKSASGDLSGYGYEYLQQMALYNDWIFKYIGYEKTWADMELMLENGDIDILTCIQKNSNTIKKFDFSNEPIGVSSTVMTVPEGQRKYAAQDYKNWNGIRVGLIRNSYRNAEFEDFAKRKNFKFIPVYFDKYSEMFAALKKRELIDAVVSTNLRVIKNEWIYETLNPSAFYIAVKKGNTALLDRVNYSIARIRTNSPAIQNVLMDKYYFGHGFSEVALTSAEHDYLDKLASDGTVLKAIANPDRAPFSSFKDGKLDGIVSEIVDEVISRTGLKVEFIETKNREEYSKVLASGNVDIWFDAWHNYSDAERRGFKLTAPYLTLSLSRLRLKSLNGAPKVYAVVEGSEIVRRASLFFNKDIELVYFKTVAEAVDAIKKKKADATFLYTFSAELELSKDERGQLVAEFWDGHSVDYSIGANVKDSHLLAAILNKAVLGITTADIHNAVFKYTESHSRKLSFIGYIYENPLFFIIAITAFFLLLSLLLLVKIIAGRATVQRAEFLRQLPVRYIVADANGKILQYSTGDLEDIYKKCALIHNINDFNPPEIAKLFKESVSEVIKTGKSININFHYANHKRSASVSKLSKSLFGVECAILVSQDTTELQLAKEEAQSNAERFLKTLKSIGDGVVVTDVDGKIVVVNQVASQMMGYPDEKLIGRALDSVFNIVSYIDGSRVSSPVGAALSLGKIVELANHTDLISASGKRFHIADTAAPIRDSEGKVVGAVLVFRDVTKEYEQRDAIKERNMLLTTASQLAKIGHLVYSTEKKENVVFVDEQFWGRRNGVPLSIKRWVGKESVSEMYEAWRDICAGKTESINIQYRAGYGNDSEKNRYFEVRCSRVVLYEGKSPEIIGSIRDITDEKIKQIERDDAFIINNALMENLPSYFLAKQIDNDFRYAFCNKACELLLGKESKNIIGRTDHELFPLKQDADIMRKDDEDAVAADGNVVFVSRKITVVSGEKRVGDFYRKVVKMADGKRLLLSLVVDTTKQEDDREKLSNAIKIATDAEKAKAFFLASMSHEIRTPLNSVIGFSNLLKDSSLSERERNEYVNCISMAGNALLDLINDILDLSKLEAGNAEIVNSKTDFGELSREMSAVFGNRMKTKNLEEISEISDMPSIYVDKQRVRQILFNLIGNSIKFTERGSVKIKADFKKKNATHGTLTFSVADTGIGISPADQKAIFHPFVQGKSMRGTFAQNNGTGLGLVICKQMLERMDGSIFVESELGRGSVFTVVINNVSYENDVAQPHFQKQSAPQMNWRDKRIILVDDIEMNLKVIDAMVKKLGAKTILAKSGKEALGIFTKDGADIILTDMWMPNMNGEQLARAIRAISGDVRVYAVTADVESDNNFDITAFDGILTKPVTIEILQEKVR